MTVDDDFFGLVGPERDRHGRPLLLPRGSQVRVPYTRASSLGDFVSGSQRGVHRWEMRYLTKGMGDNEDLAAMAAGLPPLTGDKEIDAPANQELDKIAFMAMEKAGVHMKANWGTAIHAFTDEKRPSGPVPKRMVSDVEAAKLCMEAAGATVFCTEQFIANDEVMSAGTFDKLVSYSPHELARIVDTKTGELRPHEWAVQLATYAYGDFYDYETDGRPPLKWLIDRKWAEILWVPKGQGVACLFELDIAKGWEMAKAAYRIQQWLKDETLLREKSIGELPVSLNVLINLARTVDELTKLWADHRGEWTPEHSGLARRRKAELVDIPLSTK